MAGRGRGARGAQFLEALKKLKEQEEKKAQEDQIAKDKGEPSQPRQSGQPVQPAGQKSPEESASEASTPASDASAAQSDASAAQSDASAAQSDASAPPSDASAPPSDASTPQSEASASENSASESGSQASSPSGSGSQSPAAPSSPTRIGTFGGRGKLKRYLQSRLADSPPSSPSPTPSPSPRSGTPASTDGSESQSNSSAQSAQGGDTPSPAPSSPSASPQPPPEVEKPALKPIENKVVGTEGCTLQVACNYMKLKVQPNKGVFLYHVTFCPNIDSIFLRRKSLHSAEVTAKIGDIMNFTGTNLYLPKRLESDLIQIHTTHPSVENLPLEIAIQFVKNPPHDELIPFYNNLFNRVMRELKLVQINLHHYDPQGRIDIPAHKLEVWPGHICAIQEFDGGLMLNCDTSHRVLRTTTARDMLQQIFLTNRDRFKEIATQKLVGCIVLTRYNNKPYRIDDIDFNQNPESKFNLKEGQDITYIDYFKRQWGLDIKDRKQPLLIHRPKPRRGQTESPMVCLIPELSFMTGLTDDLRSDNRAMKDLATHTKMRPAVKYAKLLEFIKKVNATPQAKKVLSDWGIVLEEALLSTTARQVRPEKLIFGKGKEVDVPARAEWGGDVRNSCLLYSTNVERWLFIYTTRDASRAEEFCKMLQQVTRNMGFSFANPRRIDIRDENPLTYVNAIRENCTNAQLVVVMTPGSAQREDRYSAIKRLCNCDLGLPSQCFRANTLNGSKMRAVCQNIALQIACKQGGQLWSIKIPLPSCMIIGLDSYHDPLNKSRSVVGVVSSINQNFTRWYSRCYFQARREEIVNSLRSAITNALRKYHEINNCLPKKIFMFRDGVGDGDLAMVRGYEIPQIEDAMVAFLKTCPQEKPLLSFVVVQKRINMKMMMRLGNDFDNPPPGTIIDHTVTRRQFYDFYLISQHVTQGTVTPTHYITLYDENNLGPDKMQRLSYKLTHLYYNFPSTIRVPAPCQYAHKLAFLMGHSCKKEAKESLADKLYFL